MIWIRVSCLIMWLVPVVLLLLKYLEIRAEKRIAGLPQDTAVTELVGRRLDDPSLWAIVASAVAALLILHGIQRFGGEPRSWANAAAVRRFGRWRWYVLALLSIGYLTPTLLKTEALFMYWRPNHDPVTIAIQAFEGVLNLVVIWIMSRFFSIALIGIDEVRSRAVAGDLRHGRSASLLASAGLLPISAFLFAPLTYHVLTWAFGLQPDFTKPWPLWIGILAILPLAIPFLIVAVYALITIKSTWYRHGLSVMALLHAVIWSGMICLGLASFVPPPFLFGTHGLPQTFLAIVGVFFLATPLALWLDFS